MKVFILRRAAVCCVVAAMLAGCAGQAALPYMKAALALRALDATGAGKIRHVVYIVQENRSFDNLFQGYPHAHTVDSGKISSGKTVELAPVGLAAYYVIDHSAQSMFAACDGTGRLPGTQCRMDGFDKEPNSGGPRRVKYPEYVYVPHNESRPYFDMAHEGALADEMFQSQLDESFVAHQYIIAAQADWAVNLPYGFWGCGGSGSSTVATITKDRNPDGPRESACFNYETLGDELDDAKLSWRFYASAYGSRQSGDGAVWSSYQAVRHIYDGPDWKNVISPNWKFITDVQAGKLANFTWITPVCDDSDHVNCPGGYGPSWVAALVNAVGQSKFWDSTAIFIQWDDWGGLYDDVAPPAPYYRDSLGFRVPLIVMSPYVKHDYVSHTQYETASVLRFAEDLWGLPQMAPADRRANSPADCFDFSQKPLKFVSIKAPKSAKFFERQLPDDYFAPDYE